MSAYYYKVCFVLIVCSTCLSGCFPITRYSSSSCKAVLSPSKKILFYYVNNPKCEECFGTVEWVFKKHQVPIAFIPAEEYNLKKLGVINPLDSQYYQLLLRHGYTHFLIIEATGQSSKRSSFEFYTPYQIELNDPYNTRNINSARIIKDNSSEAELKFALYSINDKELAYKLNVKTVLNSIIYQHDDGGATYYNLGSSGIAESTALKKGSKKMFKKCKE